MAVAEAPAAPSWAKVAVSEPVKAPAGPSPETVTRESTAVVDANAIMSGVALSSLAERLVTIPEVLEEVRDVKTRERLASLHVPLQTLEPSEEAVAAVMRFARATGDLHSLSAVDTRLIALAYTLEAATYGKAHLRDLPGAPRVRPRKHAPNARKLPGWGMAGGKWAELDALEEEEAAAAAAASGANAAAIAGEAAEGGETADAEPAAGPSADGDGVSRIAAGVQAIDLSRERGLGYESGSEAGGGGGGSDGDGSDDSGSYAGSIGGAGGETDEQGEAGDDDGWEVAKSSRNAARRQKRKDHRYQQRVAWRQEAEQAAQDQAAGSEDDDGDWMSDSGSDAGGSDAGATDAGATDAGATDAGGGPAGESTSAIVSVTADFSMQNVILQMGLRLATPDGRRITHVSRWVLRCSACFFVTKEAGRLFCPQCGNATMEKVEVTINAEGQEQYGVRKKHILRGTRFSLPKPKGGRQDGVPVLREDVMLQRMPHMRGGGGEEVDPFAPEHNQDYWFSKGASRGASARHAKGAAAILASWKHNPNERKHVRTNRRRK